MKTYNLVYKSKKELIDFIRSHKIDKYENILIQIFSGIVDKNIILELLLDIEEILPNSVIIGVTTDGEIVNQDIFTYSILISISVFDNTELIPFVYEIDDNYFAIGREIVLNASDDTKVAIIFSDSLNANGEEIVNGFNSVNSDIILAGGMAGDNGNLKESFVFTKNFISSNGVVGVYLKNRDLIVNNEYIFGWRDIGKNLKVEKVIKNRVYQIDGVKAYDIYKKYLGEELVENNPNIGIEFPIIVNRNGLKLARAVLKVNSDGSLIFNGNLYENEKVKFGMVDIYAILKDAYDKTSKLSINSIESIFVYSSMARRRFVENYSKEELNFLNKLSPVAGFYTYGEFFTIDKTAHFFNSTTTVLALSESKESIKEFDLSFEYSCCNHTTVALNNLVTSIVEELEDLNSNLEKRLHEKIEQIHKMVNYDELTGVFSKAKLEEDLKNSDYKYLILLNIDDFSRINLAYGFEMGDFILKGVVDYLKLILLNEKLYRVNGDEFAILTNSNYEDIIKAIRSFFTEHPVIINNLKFFITFSYGVSTKDIKLDILRAATIALKKAKSSSKHKVVFYHSNFDIKKEKDSIKITAALIKALKEGGIVPFYQCIVNNQTGKVDKFEVLVRMKYKDKLYSPFLFLNEAKVSGLLPEITKVLIDKSFKYMQNKSYSFSINITDEDLNDESFVDFIIDKAKYYNIDFNRVYLEILENIGNDNSYIITPLIELKRAGFNISIDDFGSKYSNFARLQEIQADSLKIDGQYIKDLDTNEKHYKIVKTIVNLANSLEMEVVAEFVHNEKIAEIVKSLGIKYSQGFYFCEPKEFIE